MSVVQVQPRPDAKVKAILAIMKHSLFSFSFILVRGGNMICSTLAEHFNPSLCSVNNAADCLSRTRRELPGRVPTLAARLKMQLLRRPRAHLNVDLLPHLSDVDQEQESPPAAAGSQRRAASER